MALALLLLLPLGIHAQTDASRREEGKELLTKALEYYQGGKYHEAILSFERLQKSFKLNPRFKAYLGYSYYKERAYEEAIANLREGIPALTAFSPHEQSVYIYSCAESLFQLERYDDAIAYYRLTLPLVEGYNKGDVLYHQAFAHYMLKDYDDAYTLFSDALAIFREGLSTEARDESHELHQARIHQTEKMLRWLKKKVTH